MQVGVGLRCRPHVVSESTPRDGDRGLRCGRVTDYGQKHYSDTVVFLGFKLDADEDEGSLTPPPTDDDVKRQQNLSI